MTIEPYTHPSHNCEPYISKCQGRRDTDTGEIWSKCNRKACNNRAQTCGGYCPSCFKRWMKRSGRPTGVVVLCGSTRFKAEFEAASRRFGLDGWIVLSVSMFGHSGDLTPEECADGHPTKTKLDLLHKQKIDMASLVYVVNPGGYIGNSTRSEIEYAEWFEKPIEYLTPVEAP